MRSLPILSPSKPGYPTASELYRARECIAPWALGLPEERETNEYAERGQRLHTMAQWCANGGTYAHWAENNGVQPGEAELFDDLSVGIDADRRVAAIATGPQSAGGKSWIVEQGIRYRPGYPDVAAFVERKPRQRFEGWFSGTADLVYVRANGVLVVADWKFGRKDQVEPAEENCQLLFLALAFATNLGVTGPSAAVVVARIELRFVGEDGVYVDGRDVSWGELCAFADELGALAERIDAGAAPKISHACGKCPSKAGCPAWDDLRLSIVEQNRHSSDALLAPPADAESARTMHFAAMAGADLVEQWKEWVRAYVLTCGPVPVGLGQSLKAIPNKNRELVDTPEALDVIERIVPGSIIVERKATMDSIKKAARASAGRDKHSTTDRVKTKDAAEKEAFASLVEAGAVIDKGKRLGVRVVRSDETEE